MHIRSQILLAYLPIIFFALLFMLGFGYQTAAGVVEDQARDQLESLASAQKNRLQTIIRNHYERFALIASRTQLREKMADFLANNDEKAIAPITNSLLDAVASMHEFNGLAVADPQGNWVARTDPDWFDFELPTQPWFSGAPEQPGIVHFELDSDGVPAMIITGPILHKNQLVGVLVVHSTLESFAGAVVDYTGLGETGETILAISGKADDVVFLTPTRFDPFAALTRTVKKQDAYTPIVQAVTGIEHMMPQSTDYRGEPVFAITRHVADLHIGIVVKQDRLEVDRPLHVLERAGLIMLLLILPAVFLPLAFIATRWISRKLERPLAELTRKAVNVYENTVGKELDIDRVKGNEIEVLGTVFENMTTALLEEKNLLETRVDERTSELRASAEALKASTDALVESKSRFEAAMDGSSDGLWDWPNTSLPQMWFSPRFYELLGYEDGAFPARINALADLIAPGQRRQVIADIRRFGREPGSFQDQFEITKKDGSVRWFAMRAKSRLDPNTKQLRMAGVLQDIMAAKVAEAEVQQMLNQRNIEAIRDPLTGALNRRGFTERLEQAGKVSNAADAETVLMLLDADHFKSVNDTWGHDVGDEVLKVLSNTLYDQLRASDISARFGGEEFVVAMPNCPLEVGLRTAERLRKAIASEETDNGQGGKLKVTCSIGVTMHAHGKKLDDSIKEADEALYQAKKNGRNRVEVNHLQDVEITLDAG